MKIDCEELIRELEHRFFDTALKEDFEREDEEVDFTKLTELKAKMETYKEIIKYLRLKINLEKYEEARKSE
ncbi:MAG: hypothetical protein IKE51_06080 [Solobacterium sp.]|nr:hypothetical protein [Solobacterium sp.]